ncbi:MAG: acetone carboxylase subunit alpha [Promethearchaeota archaeon]|nr:MAG: acetone carboxylase subunit alpha [Candidatus Lokiarchaeota archaeon]
MNTKPIGWEKSSLNEMLQKSEKLIEDTGRYYGLEKLSLKKDNPFRYERAYASLRGALVTARETALHIAASPIVKEIGELCFALYTPEGDSLVVSTGILVHVHTMSEAIKFMIREDYEQDPGINPGDIFLNNDPQTGNVHTTDVQTLIPIFWDDELIGWAGGVTHQVDAGGITPGHDLVAAIQRFDDGMYYTCRKIGSNDAIWKDHMINARRSVRTPLYWELDEKCRLAGNLMIRDAVLEFIKQEGIDYYKKFIREAIEEGRLILQKRVKERLIPGRYRAAAFFDLPLKEEAWQPRAKVNKLTNEPLEIYVKEDGTLSLDFEGCSGPGPNPMNCGIGAMEGGQWVLLTQVLIYGDKVNDGAYFGVQKNYPLGSWCNPGDPYLSYQSPWGNLIPAYTAMMKCISYGLFSRGYREEVIPGYGFTGDAIQGGGIYSSGPLEGDRWALSTFEISGQGLGASAVRDGLDWGYAMWNPESDLGDVETWELFQGGIPYLSRKIKPNTAGHGKYRGGANYAGVAMIANSEDVDFFGARDGLVFHGAGGMHGGYPHSTGYRLIAKNTNMKDIIDKQEEYPIEDADPSNGQFEKLLQADITRKPWASIYPVMLENYDMVHFAMSGGPGYGDPLERKLESVKKDLDEGIYTPDLVFNIYGVVADYDHNKGEWFINQEATEERKKEIRKERKEKSMSFDEFFEYEKSKLTKSELSAPVKLMYSESLGLSEKWRKEFIEFWNLPENFQMEGK